MSAPVDPPVGAPVGAPVDPAGRPVVPPYVYVPCARPSEGEEVEVVFRRMQDGRLALLLYTSLDRLVDCCGPHQPWVVVPAAKLDEIDRLHGYDVIIFDLPVPEDGRERAPHAVGGSDLAGGAT